MCLLTFSSSAVASIWTQNLRLVPFFLTPFLPFWFSWVPFVWIENSFLGPFSFYFPWWIWKESKFNPRACPQCETITSTSGCGKRRNLKISRSCYFPLLGHLSRFFSAIFWLILWSRHPCLKIIINELAAASDIILTAAPLIFFATMKPFNLIINFDLII